MKSRHLLMLLSLLLTTGTGWAQKPMFARKAADKLQKELRLNRTAPAAAQRIQPAASEYYYNRGGTAATTPSSFRKYDAWGNETELSYNMSDGKYYEIRTWDNSHGYPVLLDWYSYTEFPDGTKIDPEYSQYTTLDAAGVRTAINHHKYKITLDGAGHVTSYNYNRTSDDDSSESCVMTWDGDRLATLKYDYSYAKYGEEDHMTLDNIQIVHQTKPFNAYEIDYYEVLFDPETIGVWINATGTYNSNLGDDHAFISGALEIKSEVSADKKTLTTTIKVAGNVINKTTTVFLDDNGSYTKRTEYAGGDYDQGTYTYNEYGDLAKEISGVGNDEVTGWHEWEYDNGKPLQVKDYWKGVNGDTKELFSTTVFTAWHDGSSISTTAANEARILGGTLYTLDGTKVRTLTAEEAQAAEAIITPHSGIYILAVQTDRGMQTRKIVSMK